MSNLVMVKDKPLKEYKIITFHNCRSAKDQDQIVALLNDGVKVFIMLASKKMLEIKKADL